MGTAASGMLPSSSRHRPDQRGNMDAARGKWGDVFMGMARAGARARARATRASYGATGARATRARARARVAR